MLRPIDNEATLPVVWVDDDAIDQDASDIDGYISALKTGRVDWADYLHVKDGQAPTVFRLGVIPPSVMARVHDERVTSGHTQAMLVAFCNSLRDIENPGALVVDGTDARGKRKREVPKRDVNGVSYVDPTWLLGVMAGNLFTAAITLGSCAVLWNTLTQDDAKK